jgi:hypothetical protein
MLNTLSNKGNGNKNDTEIPSQPDQNGYHQEKKKQQILMKMQKKGLIHGVCGNIN